jgi:hypothetical protein
MPKKHIIIISTILIISIGFFVITWISSHRISNIPTDKKTASKDAPNTAEKVYASQNRFSSPGKAKDVALKKSEEMTTNDSKEPSDISENSSSMVDASQNDLLSDSLTSQAESQKDKASQAEESAATYTRLKEPFQQLYNLKAQLFSIVDELTGQMNIAGTGGKIDAYEYGRKLDERTAIERQILAICKEVQKIVPDAIEVRELQRIHIPDNPLGGGDLISYAVIISPPKLEASIGQIPKDIEAFFPKIAGIPLLIPEDENFSYYEANRELDRRRRATQNK